MKKEQKSKPAKKSERDVYLSTDFGDALSRLEPLNLDIEFPSPTQSISIRLPREILDRIKVIAEEQDVPYQSLIKIWLAERVKKVS
jgi:predicted DNA binding CopG/RHH family protein